LINIRLVLSSWILSDNIGSAGWPNCGELDIMENIGREPSTVHGTLHGPGYSGGNGMSVAYTLPNGKKFAAANLDLKPGDGPEIVTVEADDG
jgi:beta-glucanase (GH16 family)